MFRLSKILLPVDFSERCQGAARSARRLAERFGAEITALHVLPPHYEFGSVELGSAVLSDLIAERRERAEQSMQEFLAREFSGMRVCPRIREGDPAAEIVAGAHAGGFDLILMPTQGYGLFRRLLLGSVTAKVLHDAECPVWTGVHLDGAAPAAPPCDRILCALDLGPASRGALAWAAAFAREFQARLTVLHAIAALDPRNETFYFSPEWRQYLVDFAEKQLAALQQDLGTCAETAVLAGDPAEVVRAEAARLGAGLVVIGRGASGALGRLKSNAYGIIRTSPCPVVSV